MAKQWSFYAFYELDRREEASKLIHLLQSQGFEPHERERVLRVEFPRLARLDGGHPAVHVQNLTGNPALFGRQQPADRRGNVAGFPGAP
jgi:hypothetical protein